MGQAASGPSPRDDALTSALRELVARGQLTPDQAGEVERAYRAHTEAVPAGRPAKPARLPEVVAYLGGALVVGAVFGVVALTWWDDLGRWPRTLILLAAAAALLVSGLVVARGLRAELVAGSNAERPLGPGRLASRRRLAGVLIAASAPFTAATVRYLLDYSDRVEGPEVLLVAGTALAVAGLAVWLAPGAVPTLALAAASVGFAGVGLGLLFDAGLAARSFSLAVAFAALGVAFAGLAPRLTRTPVLALALGLGDLVLVGAIAAGHQTPQDRYDRQVAEFGPDRGWTPTLEPLEQWVSPLGFAVLTALLVVAVVRYIRGGPWPWIAAAGASVVALITVSTSRWFDSSLAPLVGLLIGGIALLVVAGLLVRRRRARESAASPPG